MSLTQYLIRGIVNQFWRLFVDVSDLNLGQNGSKGAKGLRFGLNSLKRESEALTYTVSKTMIGRRSMKPDSKSALYPQMLIYNLLASSGGRSTDTDFVLTCQRKRHGHPLCLYDVGTNGKEAMYLTQDLHSSPGLALHLLCHLQRDIRYKPLTVRQFLTPYVGHQDMAVRVSKSLKTGYWLLTFCGLMVRKVNRSYVMIPIKTASGLVTSQPGAPDGNDFPRRKTQQECYKPYPPLESGIWVVCSGCFRNWARQGYYCWDCGYDC
jgi:hypothetical protein